MRAERSGTAWRAVIARFALGVALALSLAPPVEAAPQDVEELAARIEKERDGVSPQVFYDLAMIGTDEALAVLVRVHDGFTETYQREYLLDACSIFALNKQARTGAVEFLVENARRGKRDIDRLSAVRALCAFDLDALDVLLEIASTGTDDEAKRAAVDGIAPHLLRGRHIEELDLALDFALTRPEPSTKRHYVGLPRRERASFDGLTHRDVLARCTALLPSDASLAHVLDRLASGKVSAAWRRVLVEALGDRPEPVVVKTLVRLLREPDPALVLSVLDRLLAHRERGAWDDYDTDLLPLLSSKDDAVRAAAVFTLGAFGAADPRWRTEVLKLSTSKDLATRQGAARALGELRSPDAIARLYELLVDDNWTIRYAALKAVEQLRLPESVPILIGRIEFENKRMREEIDFTLRILTGDAVGPTRWKAWLADHGEGLKLPSHADAVAAENARRGISRDGEGGSTAGFFDIRIASDRLIFICDMSSSMEELAKEVPKTGGSVVRSGRGEMTRFELAKLQLGEVLSTIPDDTLFNVYFFSHVLEPYAKQMTRMKRAVRTKVTKWVRVQFPNGSTDVYSALERAYMDAAVDTIYILTDGHPTDGPVTDPDEIRERVAHWNATRHVVIHSISLGRHSALLAGLAEDSGGTYREFL